MNIYHIWCNLKEGVGDLELTDAVQRYLGQLKSSGNLSGYRITRRKLGLGPSPLPEFHIMLEFEDLAQLDRAFTRVSSRSGETEELHFGVNAKVTDVLFALYRDFPDPHRERGEERF